MARQAAGRRQSGSGPRAELGLILDIDQENIVDMRPYAVNDEEFWPIISAGQN